jgi:hypothetical protein
LFSVVDTLTVVGIINILKQIASTRIKLIRFFGLVNICIVEKITKFDNDIFLDFRAAGESFAGSTIRLRMACP